MANIDKILFITLSNIGDCILTLPVLDCLMDEYPQAKITVMAGPRTKEIFKGNPNIDRFIDYDKHSKLKDKIRLFNSLSKESFNMIIDLRNSMFGVLLNARYKTSPFLIIPKKVRHMKERHLYRAQSAKRKAQNLKTQKKALSITVQDKRYIEDILKENGIGGQDKIFVVSPGARSHTKRWDREKFIRLCSELSQDKNIKIILVGDQADKEIADYIYNKCANKIYNLCAKTTIAQLGAVLIKSKLLITNDSAVLHIASYLNIPVIALFGPTDEFKYGPWSDICAVVKKGIFCRPCQKAQCRFANLKCSQLIKVEDVLRAVKNILVDGQRPTVNGSKKEEFKRILIVRTDRIGDVLLSTPVIKALRETYPSAFIAMMVNPYAKDIVEGNPYLDEVIIYDKAGKHKSWRRSIKFAFNLKKKRFDLTLILHPTNRVHLVTFFAGIPKRVGYDRKCGFLLTDRIKHIKQLGQKHELEYSLDLVRYLGIEPKDKKLFMPIKPESQDWVKDLFKQQGIKETDKLIAVHPGASCPSKIWPNERFAQVSDKLTEKYGFKVLVIAGPKDMKIADVLISNMHRPAINLAGKTSVSQLASVLKRCSLFISNDSGPVHIASAVGVPVISIFGRNQKGLSPTRWGPLGINDRVLHKEVGCIECLAHNCKKDFACLKAITVDDVLKVADSILKR